MNSPAGNFARVVIPSPLRDFLTYEIPPAFSDRVAAGMRVVVPLGKRQLTGVVFELTSTPPGVATREVIAVPDPRPVLDSTLLELSQWIARYYLTSIGEVLGTMLPPTLKGQSERLIVFKETGTAPENSLEGRILELCRQRKTPMTVRALTRLMNGRNPSQALQRLEVMGAIQMRDRLPGGRKRKGETVAESEASFSSPDGPVLTGEQRGALEAIERRIEESSFETFLLHGVTGSGKTEVYLRAMARARSEGRRSLILIPEISLTPQLIDRLNGRFPGKIGILHSALTGAQRRKEWWRILSGDADVVVGARSAVFAPIENLGLIVVDEEHDPSYKQEEGVRYNGRDVAVVRGKLSRCPVILGSATPAMETYENCSQGRYRLLELTRRVQGRPLPQITTIDLRSEFARHEEENKNQGTHSRSQIVAERLVSAPLLDALQQNYKNSRQSLIFLNRRGYSNFLQCALCGYVLRCSQCSVSLTLHLRQKIVCCHHCNFRRPVIDICPACSQPALGGVGVGTEQIEQLLRRLIPGARIARMDRDTTTRRGSHEELIRAWERAEIDILVGTQMITKGHDVSGVTLVGALLADLSLNVPDFRAAERTFQLLSQVAGRSGRGDDPGRVLVQTYAPDHYAIRHLISHDYKSFFAAEIEFRRALNYPPFARLVNLRLEGPDHDPVEANAKALARKLRGQQFGVEILGPAPAPIVRLRNRYRWQILLKCKETGPLLRLAAQAREWLPRSRAARLHVDVDPYSML